MAGVITGVLGDAVKAALPEDYRPANRTNLQDFLNRFQSSDGRYVNSPDPLGTFEMKIRFYPSLTAKELMDRSKNDTWLSRLGGSLLNSGKSLLKNAADNITGGLFSSITGADGADVMKQHDEFKYAGRHSFVEYLAPAHGLVGGEQWQDAEQSTAPLELDLGMYVQNVQMPNVTIGGMGKADSQFGSFPVNGNVLLPSGDLTMEIVNTKAALHERIFYPWMREVTLPYWSYQTQPYTTATITIDFTEHNDVKYVFCGCRPVQINMLKASQDMDAGNIVRDVTFAYDFMFITSDLATVDSVGSKVLGMASGLFGGASKMLNL